MALNIDTVWSFLKNNKLHRLNSGFIPAPLKNNPVNLIFKKDNRFFLLLRLLKHVGAIMVWRESLSIWVEARAEAGLLCCRAELHCIQLCADPGAVHHPAEDLHEEISLVRKQQHILEQCRPRPRPGWARPMGAALNRGHFHERKMLVSVFLCQRILVCTWVWSLCFRLLLPPHYFD